MLTKLNHVLLAGVVALACSSCQTEKKADYQVIPLGGEVLKGRLPSNTSPPRGCSDTRKAISIKQKCFHYLSRRQPLAETQR